MESQPFKDEMIGTNRQLAGYNRAIIDGDQRPVLTLLGVKVRGVSIVMVHHDDDPVKPANRGHRFPSVSRSLPQRSLAPFEDKGLKGNRWIGALELSRLLVIRL